MTNETYNGWTNYETWLVALWIDNEEHSHHFWRDVARERDTVYEFASEMRETFETMAENKVGASDFWADMMGAALSEVDWHSVAGNLIDEVKENAIG